MDARFRRFRAWVEDHFGGRPGPGCRYPEKLRQAAVALGREAELSGWLRSEVAEELGLDGRTLSRWMDQMPRAEVLRPVELVAEEASPSPLEEPVEGSLSVVTPRGLRVEGLSLEQAMTLVSVLG